MLEYSCWGWGSKSEIAHDCLFNSAAQQCRQALRFSHLCSLRIYQSHLWVNFLCAHRVAAAAPNMTSRTSKAEEASCVRFLLYERGSRFQKLYSTITMPEVTYHIIWQKGDSKSNPHPLNHSGKHWVNFSCCYYYYITAPNLLHNSHVMNIKTK